MLSLRSFLKLLLSGTFRYLFAFMLLLLALCTRQLCGTVLLNVFLSTTFIGFPLSAYGFFLCSNTLPMSFHLLLPHLGSFPGQKLDGPLLQEIYSTFRSPLVLLQNLFVVYVVDCENLHFQIFCDSHQKALSMSFVLNIYTCKSLIQNSH